MNTQAMLTDLLYALKQIEIARTAPTHGQARDAASRAQDAMERMEGQLRSEASVSPEGWDSVGTDHDGE